MKIGGKEYGFKLTVGASVQIARLCPDGDLARISEAVGTNYGEQAETLARMISALSNGYAAAEAVEGREAARLSVEDVLSVDPKTFEALTREAFAAFSSDIKGEVEVKPTKKAAVEG